MGPCEDYSNRHNKQVWSWGSRLLPEYLRILADRWHRSVSAVLLRHLFLLLPDLGPDLAKELLQSLPQKRRNAKPNETNEAIRKQIKTQRSQECTRSLEHLLGQRFLRTFDQILQEVCFLQVPQRELAVPDPLNKVERQLLGVV